MKTKRLNKKTIIAQAQKDSISAIAKLASQIKYIQNYLQSDQLSQQQYSIKSDQLTTKKLHQSVKSNQKQKIISLKSEPIENRASQGNFYDFNNKSIKEEAKMKKKTFYESNFIKKKVQQQISVVNELKNSKKHNSKSLQNFYAEKKPLYQKFKQSCQLKTQRAIERKKQLNTLQMENVTFSPLLYQSKYQKQLPKFEQRLKNSHIEKKKTEIKCLQSAMKDYTFFPKTNKNKQAKSKVKQMWTKQTSQSILNCVKLKYRISEIKKCQESYNPEQYHDEQCQLNDLNCLFYDRIPQQQRNSQIDLIQKDWKLSSTSLNYQKHCNIVPKQRLYIKLEKIDQLDKVIRVPSKQN